MTIDREQLIAEELIREHVRKRIALKLDQQRLAEDRIRKVVRQLIEAETGTEEASRSTGINVLADLLQNIIPTVEDDYKMLTSSKEQRESFKNHIVHAIENSLRPIEANTQGEKKTENIEYEIDADTLLEKISIDLDPQDDGKEAQSIEGEFIDIDGDGDKEEPMKKAVKDKKKKEESFDPRAEQSREEEAYQELVSAYDKGGEEELCKAIGCSMKELDQEMTEFAMDHSLHMDDDRDEIIHGYIEQLVDNADWKDHGEQDFDRADMEMGEELDRMRELAGIEEQSADTDVDNKAMNSFTKYRGEVEKNYGEEGLKYYYDIWQEVKRQRGSKANAGEAYRMTVQKFAGQEMTKQLEM